MPEATNSIVVTILISLLVCTVFFFLGCSTHTPTVGQAANNAPQVVELTVKYVYYEDGKSYLCSEEYENEFRIYDAELLNPGDVIYLAIDAELNDEYDTCSGAYELLDLINDKSTWSKVADELLRRLNNLPTIKEGSDNFNLKYRRKHLSNFLTY